jgi:hypothetical protein
MLGAIVVLPLASARRSTTRRTSDVSSYDTVARRFSEIEIDSSFIENVFDIPRGPSRCGVAED